MPTRDSDDYRLRHAPNKTLSQGTEFIMEFVTKESVGECWERHTTKCNENGNLTSTGKKCSKCRGIDSNIQLREYAIRVNEKLTGFKMTNGLLVCPITGETFNARDGQVDKANEPLGYRPGNVVMTSVNGNQGRGKLQQWRGDMGGRIRYIGDVAMASADIRPMRRNACREFNRLFPVTGGKPPKPHPDYMGMVERGPYGQA